MFPVKEKSIIYCAICLAVKGALYPGNASSNISVCTAPKAKTLKEGPVCLNSSASSSVRVINAPLLLLYAASPGNLALPCTPPILLILTTWLDFLKKGKTAWVREKTPNTFTS